MYRNLEAELARKAIKKKELAELLDVRQATIYDKINGKFPFTLDEAVAIRNNFFEEMNVEYLFKKFE